MKELFRKVVIILITIAVLIGGTVLVFTHTGYDQSAQGSNQLIAAIKDNDAQKVIDVIKQYPQSVNALPTTSPWWWQLLSESPQVYYPLQVACYIGNNEMIKLLIDNGADVNLVYKGIEGSKPPLTLSIFSQSETRLENVKLLVESGADKTIQDNAGKTAYDYAVENGFSDLAELLKT